MIAYVYYPGSDGEFEFEVECKGHPGCEAYTFGLPENCRPAEAAEAEIIRFGPFADLLEAVEYGAWTVGCVVSRDDIRLIASTVERQVITKFIEEMENYEPELDSWRED